MKLASMRMKLVVMLFVFVLMGGIAIPQEDTVYQLPPKEIVTLLDIPRTPSLVISPDARLTIIAEAPQFQSIETVSQPELKLAGIRINPKTNGPGATRIFYYKNLKLKDLKNMKEYPITGLPADPKISNFSWAPDSRHVAFFVTQANGIELWAVDAATGKATKLTEAIVNEALEASVLEWLPDSQHLLFKAVCPNRPDLPRKNDTPKGPVVQCNDGQVTPVKTFQDLLTCAYDEELFTHYATSQLMTVDLNGNAKPIGTPGIIKIFDPSPNGAYILVESIKSPFSYQLPCYFFPYSVQIWDIEGKVVKTLADIPLLDYILPSNDATMKGPRQHTWRSDAPATLYWVEAQDEGNPFKEVEFRDKIYFLKAPFSGKVLEGPALKYRFNGIYWGTGKMALIQSEWWKTRQTRTEWFQPDLPGQPTRIVFDRSSEDRYKDPGMFALYIDRNGKPVLKTDKAGKYLYLRGRGSSPEGDRPFIDQYDIKTGKITRLWRSEAPYYETVIALLDIDQNLVLTSREGKKIQPNYYIRNLQSKKLNQITFFPHPFPMLKDVEKQLITYKRPDGVELSGNLYLPVGYKKTDGPLPVVMWAYPSEFKTRSAAGQLNDSPYRFIRITWGSPLMWITQGYAVFDNPAMPIIGEGKQEPNDTYIEQLVADAKAAIDKLADMGIGDRNRVAIGGHSYGAFMTANLLAHSRLFAAGIARSGAYNRTLTPYGFQNEERDLWQAPETYIKLSPFMYADKVKDPLLMIHGQNDDNVGTFPIQSERFFQALKGKGAVVRLVMLPYESHGYFARESIMHVLWETYNWLEKYVKNKK
ncbi:MAG: S9 family peptidase [Candidatus Omnitrophota bacterium]